MENKYETVINNQSNIEQAVSKPRLSFGWISFWLSFSFIYLLVALLIITVLCLINGQKFNSYEELGFIVGILALLSQLFNFIGVIFGIVGLVKEKERRTIAVLGLVFNILSLLLFIYICNT